MSTVWTAPIAEAVSVLIVEHGGSPDRLAQALTSATEQAIKAGIHAERERCAELAERHGETVSNEPIGKACARNIAAAIRKGTA